MAPKDKNDKIAEKKVRKKIEIIKEEIPLFSITGVLSLLKEDNFVAKINYFYKGDAKMFSFTLNLKYYKIKKQFALSYNFLLNPKDDSNMYEISWNIKEDSVKDVIIKYQNVLENIEKRIKELNITVN